MLQRIARLPAWAFVGAIVLAAVGTVMVVLLLENISQRQQEARQTSFRVVELTEDTEDPAIWGQNFPRQYDGYKRTVDVERTRYGGSEDFSKLDADPLWKTIFNGYPFGVDYREERGHAYMLLDQRNTERVKLFKQPGACLNCHASVLPAFRAKGVEAGVPNDEPHRQEAIMKGFELMNSVPYTQATKLVTHPVSCIDCHSPTTMQLRVTRPAFLIGIQALASSDSPVPFLPSVERWRSDGRVGTYDPNSMATRQELRSMACAQCHVEYYFKGDKKQLTFPWAQGVRVEQIEAYYNEVKWKDWTHKDSGALVLKAQHPEFEMWSQGIHARSGVACADCHMPYTREGAVKVSDHHIRSPLLNVANACLTCHHFSEDEMKARAEAIQSRTQDLLMRAEQAVVALIGDIQKAKAAGLPDDKLLAAQTFQRQAQWRLDFVAAENSLGFHAPQEAARILAESIDYARQGQLELARQGMPTAQCIGCHEPSALLPTMAAPPVAASADADRPRE